MNLVIGNVDYQMTKFLRKQNFTEKTLVINKICNVKYLTEPVVIYIPFGVINKYGIVNNTMVHLEELLITLNVLKVYYGDERNIEYLNKLKDIYGVDFIKINCK